MAIYSDAEIQAMRGHFNLGFFLRVDTDPALHLWWGVSDIEQQIKDVVAADETYIGAGMMTDVPDSIEVLLNGSADQIEFSMNGVNAALLPQFAIDAPPVLGAETVFGFCPMDDLWQPTTKILPSWRGFAEAWTYKIDMPESAGADARGAITLLASSGSVARSATSLATWTDRAQQRLSPGDRGCERTPMYYQGRRVTWPRF